MLKEAIQHSNYRLLVCIITNALCNIEVYWVKFLQPNPIKLIAK